MEIKEDSSTGCYRVVCKLPATNTKCAKGQWTGSEKCGSTLVTYQDTSCYEGVGVFELEVTNIAEADPYWNYEFYSNGGTVDWEVEAYISGTMGIRGSGSRCDFDYWAQPFTSETDAWKTGSIIGGGQYVTMPENWEILGGTPNSYSGCSIEIYSMDNIKISATSDTDKVIVKTKVSN